MSLNAPSAGKAVTTTLSLIANGGSRIISVSGMPFSVRVLNGSPWLSVSPLSGNTPGLVTITADPSSLVPGLYTGTITIDVPLAKPSSRMVNVQFTVGASVSPNLAVDRDRLSFTYATTSAARSQSVTVTNQGGGPLAFTTSVTMESGQTTRWLSVTPQSGTATPSNPVILSIGADPGGLPPGTYTGRVTVAGTTPGTGSVTIQVVMTVTTNPRILLLSQTGLTFTAVQNGGTIPAQTFGVLNLGSGTLNWTVETSTLAGGNWLLATPGSGSSGVVTSSGAPLVTVSVNTAQMQPGVYYGLVTVRSTGAANTPQEVVVVLQLLPAGTDVAPIVQPGALVFSGTVGNSSPGSQDVLVYDPTGTNKSFRSGRATVNGGEWFVTLPGDATIARDQPARIVVQPLVNNLGPGSYQGTLTLQFSDGRVSTVGITFVVNGGTGTAGGKLIRRETPQETQPGSQCPTPSQLYPSLISLGSGFNVPTGFAEGLVAQVVDDCGAPVADGAVTVSASNDPAPPRNMLSHNNGRWDNTWTPTGTQAGAVSLTVTAQKSIGSPPKMITGSSVVPGTVGAANPRPVISNGGVVSAASFAASPVAPGGVITILGTNLADADGGKRRCLC